MITKTQIKRIEKIENLQQTIVAAEEFRALRDRRTNPDGRFDNAGRFYLHCRASCCTGIRTPSRHFPFSELLHARSALHVATWHGVDAADVRYIARLVDAGIPGASIPNAQAAMQSDAALAAIDAVCA